MKDRGAVVVPAAGQRCPLASWAAVVVANPGIGMSLLDGA